MATAENQTQYLSAYTYRAQGMGRGEILSNLNRLYPRRAPHVRTLGKWLLEFDDVPEDEKVKDRHFYWSDMERYGIPWTNSQSVVEHVFRYAEEKREEPTGRQALWTWKILQFTRFQNIIQGREQLLYNLVQRFVTNELQILLNQTLTETRENLSREIEALATSGGRR